MTTVRQLVAELADGTISVRQVLQDFRTRPWPSGRRELTDGQMHGTEDVPPPTDNSPDWIEIQAGLTEDEREQLRQAYDQAQGS